jgi:hypothetical protein
MLPIKPLPGQHPIPFEPDHQELAMMGEQYAVTRKDSDTYLLWDRLATAGYVRKDHLPNFGGMYQFSLSLRGINYLRESNCE